MHVIVHVAFELVRRRAIFANCDAWYFVNTSLLSISAARNERLRLAASSSLDVVAEADGSPEPVSASEDFKPFDASSASMYSSQASFGVQQTEDKEHSSVLEHGFDSGIANSSSDPSDTSYSSSTLTSKLVSSTPLQSSENRSFGDVEDKSPSPIPAAPPVKPVPSDSDDEFFDASSDFSEEVQQLLLTSSLHEDQLGGNGMLPDDDSGISVVRNCMTQSLMKVEEETPVSQLIVQPNNSKPLRSSSVSPRPLTTAASNMKPSKMNSVPSNEYTESLDQLRNQHSTTTPLSSRSRGTAAKPQARLSRPATTTLRPLATPRPAGQSATPLGLSQRHVAQSNVRVPNPKAQLLQTLISTPVAKDADRNSNNTTTPDNAMSRAASATRPSPQSQDDIPDLAALREIARQQEEALRQAVEQQQHGYVERKHSWQNDALSKSAHSSAGSLVSSKSVDMTMLHKANANSGSKIPGPTKVPRRTGIPAPSKRLFGFRFNCIFTSYRCCNGCGVEL
ncbi:hypothetical protein Y032_0111g217 [Ancylostoma ceylanicum]|uniref:Uncharacterized protein n=1 Tax=Ancylostoma ceylanicum TaxID=53326 RepID=A0A016TE81_9BILA|nr:hypothetical protein Y032_0111g217 [Ancylostoma ceylanicum]